MVPAWSIRVGRVRLYAPDAREDPRWPSESIFRAGLAGFGLAFVWIWGSIELMGYVDWWAVVVPLGCRSL